jgi:hypothetical protein
MMNPEQLTNSFLESLLDILIRIDYGPFQKKLVHYIRNTIRILYRFSI